MSCVDILPLAPNLSGHACGLCSRKYASQHWLETHIASRHTVTGPFTCYSCRKAWATQDQLLKHMLVHGPKIYRCTVCGKAFPMPYRLTEHLKIHKKERQQAARQDPAGENGQEAIRDKALPHQCPVCDKCFAVPSVFVQHMKTHRQMCHPPSKAPAKAQRPPPPEPRQTALILKQVPPPGADLRQGPVIQLRLPQQGSGPPQTCLLQLKLAPNPTPPRPNAQQTSATPVVKLNPQQISLPYQCIMFNQAFIQERISQHLKTQGNAPQQEPASASSQGCASAQSETPDGASQTPNSDQPQPQPEDTQPKQPENSKNTAEKDVVVVNEITPKEGASDGSLLLKVLTQPLKPSQNPPPENQQQPSETSAKAKPQGSRLYKCKVCSKVYALKKSLTQHAKVHRKTADGATAVEDDEGNLRYKCTFCEKTFTLRKRITEHLKIHQRETELRLGYDNMPVEKGYGKIHLGALPHQCAVCTERFRNRLKLRVHMQAAHPDTRPFACDVCSWCFKTETELKKHQLTHKQGPPFKCFICYKEFDTLEDCRSHEESHRRTENHWCFDCRACFGSEEQLNEHCTNAHEEDDMPSTSSSLSCHGCMSCGLVCETMYDLEVHRARKHSGKGPYSCYSCAKVTPTRKLLLYHLKIHGVKPYKCEFCGKEFSSEIVASKHKKIHEKIFVCPECKETFRDVKSLNEHKRKEHKPPKHRCTRCDKEYIHKCNLVTHMLAAHAEGRLHPCDVCGVSFETELKLTDHRKEHPEDDTSKQGTDATEDSSAKGEEDSESASMDPKSPIDSDPLSCEPCDLIFDNLHAMETHRVEKHSDSGPFTCYRCSAVCGSNTALLEHLKLHIPLNFQCNICGGSFDTEPELNAHIKLHKNTYQCYVCDKSLACSKSLKSHLQIHEAGFPHQCELCGKVFRTKNSLTLHQTSHQESRPFECDLCQKRFKSLHYWRTHVRAHKDKGTHKCDVCHKMFSSKSTLHVHRRRIHEGYKPYQCHLCGRKCVSNPQLAEHMHVHTRQAQFECEICHVTFGWLNSLKRHRRNHEVGETFVCAQCGVPFTSKRDLRRHHRLQKACAGPDVDNELDSDGGSEPEPDVEPDSERETDSESEQDSQPETDSESKASSGPRPDETKSKLTPEKDSVEDSKPESVASSRSDDESDSESTPQLSPKTDTRLNFSILRRSLRAKRKK